MTPESRPMNDSISASVIGPSPLIARSSAATIVRSPSMPRRRSRSGLGRSVSAQYRFGHLDCWTISPIVFSERCATQRPTRLATSVGCSPR